MGGPVIGLVVVSEAALDHRPAMLCRATGITAEVEFVQRLENTQDRADIGDLRHEVGVDIAVADTAQRCVAGIRIVAGGAHAKQGLVVQDRVLAEQADIAAQFNRAESRCAHGDEGFAEVDAGGAKRGRVAAVIRVQRANRSTVNARVGAKHRRKIDAVLCRAGRNDDRARQQAVTH